MDTDKHRYSANNFSIIAGHSRRLPIAGWVCALVLVGGVWSAAAENPYSPIVVRNIFDLVPIPVHNPADDVPVNPPPKITPNGIMTIFGKLQVLFKVAENTPGKPVKEIAYTMGEGERQDEITVQKIDENAATITFDNHGTVQTLELAKSSGGGSAPAPGAPGMISRPLPPGFAAPAGSAHAPMGFGGRFGRERNVPPPASNPANSASPGFGNSPAPSANTASTSPPMSPEEQVLMIEAQRMKFTQDGDPTAAILPPTELTPEATGQNADDGDQPQPAPGR